MCIRDSPRVVAVVADIRIEYHLFYHNCFSVFQRRYSGGRKSAAAFPSVLNRCQSEDFFCLRLGDFDAEIIEVDDLFAVSAPVGVHIEEETDGIEIGHLDESVFDFCDRSADDGALSGFHPQRLF